MKGKVLAISEEKRRVKLSYEKTDEEDGSVTVTEKWFDLGPKVQVKFLRKEECEFEIDKEDEEVVPFITFPKKEKKSDFKTGDSFDSRESSEKAKLAWEKVKQGRISRSGALNTAIDLKKLNLNQSKDGIKEEITTEQIIEIAQEFEKYIEGE
jgi:hypothetical protein